MVQSIRFCLVVLTTDHCSCNMTTGGRDEFSSGPTSMIGTCGLRPSGIKVTLFDGLSASGA